MNTKEAGEWLARIAALEARVTELEETAKLKGESDPDEVAAVLERRRGRKVQPEAA